MFSFLKIILMYLNIMFLYMYFSNLFNVLSFFVFIFHAEHFVLSTQNCFSMSRCSVSSHPHSQAHVGRVPKMEGPRSQSGRGEFSCVFH